MKIRKDFVTNSSSSSFVTELDIDFEDGAKMNISGRDEDGDFCFQSLDMSINGKNYSYSPMEYYWGETGNYGVDDIPWDIKESVLVYMDAVHLNELDENLKENITRPFGLSRGFNTDEEDEYECEESAEIVNALCSKFNLMVNECNKFLEEHLESDMTRIKLNMEFGGRGEGLSAPEEIVNLIFGDMTGGKICSAATKDEDEAVAEIKNLTHMELYDDESIKKIIRFLKKCDYCPMECEIKQVRENGKIHISISYS